MHDEPRTIYDQVPYPSLNYKQSHPDRLATLATLLGLEPTPVDRCRVLELGCASGGNLLPMAYALPGSEFVGVDSSSRQIDEGESARARLGLGNVSLVCMDILDITPELGTFDYIIAHAVYSWVPAEVRDKILAVCKDNLAPNGVAYVSYNAYPGWHMMGIIREAMLYRTQKLTDPKARATQARAMLGFLTEAVSAEGSAFGSFLEAYAELLKAELKGVGSRGDAFLLHDELEEVNQPVYFHQFAEHAREHGLQYLVEADLHTVLPEGFSPEVKEALQEMAADVVDMEQYMDFARNRMFRRTLLCHEDIEIERTLSPDRVTGLLIASRARPESDRPDIRSVSVERFRGPDGATLSTDHPVSKAAMLSLRVAWPRALSFQELLAAAKARVGESATAEAGSGDAPDDAFVLAANLLTAYGYSAQLVELHVSQPPLAYRVAERPLASPVARLQAEGSNMVANLWHERVELDALLRHLLRYLDGTRDREALLDELVGLAVEGVLGVEEEGQPVADPDAAREILDQGLEKQLQWLCQAGLLVG